MKLVFNSSSRGLKVVDTSLSHPDSTGEHPLVGIIDSKSGFRIGVMAYSTPLKWTWISGVETYPDIETAKEKFAEYYAVYRAHFQLEAVFAPTQTED